MPRAKKLPFDFFNVPSPQLAPALIGTTLVHRLGDRELRARIVETEAYCGINDLASHASKGRTARTDVMFGPAARAYVYLIYGMYQMLNVVAGKTHEGDAEAVLIRAAEPLGDWEADLSGPGKLAKRMLITREYNRLDLTGDTLFFLPREPGHAPRIVRTPRVGVDYAKHWKDELLRYCDADSAAVSKPRPPADAPPLAEQVTRAAPTRRGSPGRR